MTARRTHRTRWEWPTRSRTSGQAAGQTTDPQLTGVALSVVNDLFSNPVGETAVYTFDENVTLNSTTQFKLWSSTGARFIFGTDGGPCAAGNTATPGDTSDDNTVTCTVTTVPDGAAAVSAVTSATLGTVDDAAVVDTGAAPADTDVSVDPNPEGAEPTTGGTGTPA